MSIETLCVEKNFPKHLAIDYVLTEQPLKIGHISNTENNIKLYPNDKIRKLAVTREGERCYLPPVSREHCQIRLIDGVRCIEDLGSRTGTYVNGERISEERQAGHRPLLDGDTIELIPNGTEFWFRAKYQIRN